ncbi:MAG: hypothetical protein RSB41_00925 [Bacilli bacterium]
MEYIKEHKSTFIAVCIILGIIIIFAFVNIFVKHDSLNKKYSDKEYVYTYMKSDSESKNQISRMPQINLKSDYTDNINKEIQNKFFDLTAHDFNLFDYEYSIYNGILSLLIKTDTMSVIEGTNFLNSYKDETICSNDFSNISYYVYNIDIKNKKIVSNQELLTMFNISDNDKNIKLDNILNDRFIAEKDMLKGQDLGVCNYNCYINELKLNDIKQSNVLFIKNKSLYSLYSYDLYRLYGCKNNFPDNYQNNFYFKITE